MSVLIIRVLLAAVFAAAAAAKTAAPAAALPGFGVPRWLVRPLAAGLPAAELAVAASLLPASTAWYGALAAAGLLAGFTAAVAYQLARGRRPDCNCFGRLRSKPIGPSTLVRNGVLLGLGAFAVVAGRRDAGPSVVGWLGQPLPAAIAGLSALVVVQAVLLVLLLRRHGQVLLRLDGAEADPEPAGLPVGGEAPEFSLPDLDGEPVSLESLRRRGLPVLLVFSDPACGPCSALLPEVGRWQREHAGELTVALISTGDLDDNRARAAEHGLTLVLRQEAHSVGLAYGANGTPMAVLVHADGHVASEVAAGGAAVAALVSTVVDRAFEEVLTHA